MIKIVGVGPGEASLMTFMGKEAIERADILIGAPRHLEKWNKSDIQTFAINKSLSKIVDCINDNIEKNIVVLASGEPALYGIASYLRKHFKAHVISGISSVQYLFSKIDINMNDVYITSTHGKNVDFRFLETLNKVAMVTDKKIGPRQIAKELKKLKSNKKMIVGEHLSYEDEKIYHFDDLEKVLECSEFKMNVVIIYEEIL